MPYTTSQTMLKQAQRDGYAVGAFNAENLEMILAIIEAAEELRAPVMIQTTPSTLKYAPPHLFSAAVRSCAEKAGVPVCLHLDHGDSIALAAVAVRAGYSSVMIDGSRFSLEENARMTRRVVDICAPNEVPVEGELGQVGGKEDDLEAESGYTDPDEAVYFVEKTGVGSLAVGVGTAHGIYKAKPVLNMDLISVLRKRLQIPMVLHGASGLSRDIVKECISRGICKVNFATELRMAYTDTVRGLMDADKDVVDPKKYGAAAREAVKELVKSWIRTCGCAERA